MDNMQDQNTQQNTGTDKQALDLTHAIALQESGSDGKPDYTAVGDNGTSKGAYQWQPGNFEAAAKSAGLDPNDFSPENQDKVAYSEIKGYKDKGYDPGQIASLWNSGSPNNWQNHSGTTTINGKKISYDTPAYVKGVQKYYQQLTGNSQSPQQSSNPFQSITTANIPKQQNPEQTPQDSAAPGNFISNLGKGNYGDAAESGLRDFGNAVSFGGTEQFAPELGTSLAFLGEKAKGLVGGQDNSKYLPDVNNANAFAGAGKIAAGAGLQAAGTGLLRSFLGSGGSALGSDIAQQALSDYAVTGPGETINSLSSAEKLNALTNAISDASPGEKIVLQKAVSELSPSILQEAGIGSFSELHPALAKTLGITVKALKVLAKLAVIPLAGAGFSEGEKLTGLLK